MSLAITYCRAQQGIDAPLITVEVHLSNGLPCFTIVGLPETTVREARDRVRSALLNSNFEFPARRITVNLAPADLPKEGGRYDLAIALGILAASEQLRCADLGGFEFIGELALSGELRAVKGILPVVMSAKNAGRRVLLPAGNGPEAAIVGHTEIYSSDHLLGATAHLSGESPLEPVPHSRPVAAGSRLDLSDVRGQEMAKRALEVAAAGRHSLLMAGPPGTGKTMLASRITGILPRLSDTQALAVGALRSLVAIDVPSGDWLMPPFRSPHHSCSGAALVGGGRLPVPGEISLAHHGVLFLDELPEFNRSALEQLREPIESGVVHVSRAAQKVEFPADFQLICAMNPCPCGRLGDPGGRCRCTEDQVRKYRSKLSGPLLDRIDIQIEVPALPREYLADDGRQPEPSSAVRKRVIAARERQRFRNRCLNHALSGAGLEAACRLGKDSRDLLLGAMDRLGLSARAYHRIIRVARTIADLDDAADISTTHISEAISYRSLDRSF